MQYLNLKEIERRPLRYWNVDGLPDLMMGILWIIWGTAFILPELLPPGRWLFYYWTAMPAILIVGGFASNWAIKKLKQRLTFVRTGYVSWPEPGVAMKILPALLAAGVAAGVVMLVSRGNTQTVNAVAAPGIALLLALAFLIAAARQKLPHYCWLSAASLLLAIVIARTALNLGHGLVCLFLSLGVISALVGAVRLRVYLRRNPPPEEGEA